MQRTRVVKVVGVGAALTLGVALLTGAEEKPDAPKSPTAGETYKNIKVLKDLPADQLPGYMQKIGQSLGVGCDFCHVMADFSSDEKPTKNAARAMLVMTQKLNATEPAVDKKVTCYMCHHARAMPARSEEEWNAGMKKPAGSAKPGAAPSQGGDSNKGDNSGASSDQGTSGDSK